MRRNGGLVAAAAVLALGLAGAALAGLVMHRSAGSTRIAVTLREYRIPLKRTSTAGSTTFVVTNRGTIVHAFEISGPGIGKKRIAGTIAPGRSKTLTVKLTGGKYTVWCPIPGHAALGMKTTLTVSGGAGGGGSTTGTTTEGGGGGGWG